MDKYAALREYFGYTSFRDGQEQLIDSLLSGRDVFGIMPTGGGKSICYQIPAVLLPGITIVVSPLVSLMQDQVLSLKEAGIPAAYINSILSASQLQTVFSRVRQGCYKIVYVAPERLTTESFLHLTDELDISLVAVDEAHCISSWGQDFRPSYLRIAGFLEGLSPRPTVAAFTATATDNVRKDVEKFLKLREPLRVITGFDRPNLRYEVLRPKDKSKELLRLLLKHESECGIVYCSTRSMVEEVCELLCGRGLPATRYHAGLSEKERKRNQDDFVYDRRPIMVATNAFGMGIDKSNVRYVIHYNMPQSIEAYYQEAGRAGRDGERADCYLLYGARDVRTAEFLIRNGEPNELLTEEEKLAVEEAALKRLWAMVHYCKMDECLRGFILSYFGQAAMSYCGNCSNCADDALIVDITREAQMVLSCVRRIRNTLGFYVGVTAVVRTLHGSSEQRIRDLRLDAISTYGLMRTIPRETIRAYIDCLILHGYLIVDEQYKSLQDTDKADEILFGGQELHMKMRRKTQTETTVPTPVERGIRKYLCTAPFAPRQNRQSEWRGRLHGLFRCDTA